MEKCLLNLKEFCEYLGIGQTKAREILTKQSNNFVVRIGNRLYVNKALVDIWINDSSGNKEKNKKNRRKTTNKKQREKLTIKRI